MHQIAALDRIDLGASALVHADSVGAEIAERALVERLHLRGGIVEHPAEQQIGVLSVLQRERLLSDRALDRLEPCGVFAVIRENITQGGQIRVIVRQRHRVGFKRGFARRQHVRIGLPAENKRLNRGKYPFQLVDKHRRLEPAPCALLACRRKRELRIGHIEPLRRRRDAVVRHEKLEVREVDGAVLQLQIKLRQRLQLIVREQAARLRIGRKAALVAADQEHRPVVRIAQTLGVGDDDRVEITRDLRELDRRELQ